MIDAYLRPLSELPRVLPELAATLSVSRAQLVIDQLTSLVEQRRSDRILLVTCDAPVRCSEGLDGAPSKSQGCVVVYHPEEADFATILLAGAVTPDSDPTAECGDGQSGEPPHHRDPSHRDPSHRDPSHRDSRAGHRNGGFWEAMTDSLATELGRQLKARGVHFLQYATDIRDQDSQSSQAEIDENGLPSAASFPWQYGLGLQHLGDLEYQSGVITDILRCTPHEDRSPIRLQKIAGLGHLSSLVERTYAQTLDCPRLARFRSAEQTLAGYRLTDAFAPQWWFTVHRDLPPTSHHFEDSDGAGIGCLIMGLHTSDTSTPITEIVYMGLVPEARGEGLGGQILHQAARVSQSVGADRMILAVDEINHPARRLYHRAGMTCMMRETVWGKQIN